MKRLLHEGNVSRIIIKHEGHSVLEIPTTVGLVGMLIAPWLAAVGATIEVIRTEHPETPAVS